MCSAFCHVRLYVILGLCQQEGTCCGPSTLNQNKPLFFVIYSVWDIVLLALEKELAQMAKEMDRESSESGLHFQMI
jgi:hypothetical protein